jgi:hypothetical protein
MHNQWDGNRLTRVCLQIRISPWSGDVALRLDALGKPINVGKSAFFDKSSAQGLSMNSDHWLSYLTAEGIIISQTHLRNRSATT